MANQIFKPKRSQKSFWKKSQNLFENATTNYTNVNYHQIWNYFKTAMLSEDIQKIKKSAERKKEKQKRDTNTKLKTHLNVTPKTNEKKK